MPDTLTTAPVITHTRPVAALWEIFEWVPAVSGMGGPLMHDFHHALELDAIIARYGCDAIIETGTHFGESTEYLAQAYPHLPIHTCEIHEQCFEGARVRLAPYSNVRVWHGSSPTILAQLPKYERPLYFLDAHWEDFWPLQDELRTIRAGVVCIHDCDVGDEQFGFDTYGGVVNGPSVVNEFGPVYGNNRLAVYPVRSMPTHRRGRGYVVIGLEDRLEEISYLKRLDDEATRRPNQAFERKKIAMVTLWGGSAADQMAAAGNPGKRRYCEAHGYDFVEFRGTLDPCRPMAWSKILAIKQILLNYDWVLWCDVDTVLWNSDIALEPFLADASEVDFIVQKNHQALNAGVFFIRNTPWSYDFLERVYAQTQFLEDAWNEQAAMIAVLNDENTRHKCRIYSQQEPYAGFHGFCFYDDWDKLLIHFAGQPNQERIALMENLARLARLSPERRLLARDALGDLLNRLGLIGEGAEVGVYRGDFSRKILSQWQGRQLHLIDAWRQLDNYTDICNFADRQHEECYEATKLVAKDFAGRVTIHRALSSEAVLQFEDESLDFVYLDANHSYEAVRDELVAWYPKVRPGGVFAGHDFLDGELPQGKFGVRRAVLEFEERHNLPVAVTAEKFWPTWYVIKPGADS